MNVLALVVTLISFITSFYLSDASKWHDCGDSNSTVHWENLKIPDPFRFKDLKLGAKYTIGKEVPLGSTSKVEVWRVIRVLLVPLLIRIPCQNILGSCDLDLCRKADYDNFCLFQETAANTTCGCPMTPKTVEGYDYRVKIKDVKLSLAQQLFANGYYKIRWTWFDPNLARIGCVEVETNIRT